MKIAHIKHHTLLGVLLVLYGCITTVPARGAEGPSAEAISKANSDALVQVQIAKQLAQQVTSEKPVTTLQEAEDEVLRLNLLLKQVEDAAAALSKLPEYVQNKEEKQQAIRHARDTIQSALGRAESAYQRLQPEKDKKKIEDLISQAQLEAKKAQEAAAAAITIVERARTQGVRVKEQTIDAITNEVTKALQASGAADGVAKKQEAQGVLAITEAATGAAISWLITSLKWNQVNIIFAAKAIELAQDGKGVDVAVEEAEEYVEQARTSVNNAHKHGGLDQTAAESEEVSKVLTEVQRELEALKQSAAKKKEALNKGVSQPAPEPSKTEEAKREIDISGRERSEEGLESAQKIVLEAAQAQRKAEELLVRVEGASGVGDVQAAQLAAAEVRDLSRNVAAALSSIQAISQTLKERDEMIRKVRVAFNQVGLIEKAAQKAIESARALEGRIGEIAEEELAHESRIQRATMVKKGLIAVSILVAVTGTIMLIKNPQAVTQQLQRVPISFNKATIMSSLGAVGNTLGSMLANFGKGVALPFLSLLPTSLREWARGTITSIPQAVKTGKLSIPDLAALAMGSVAAMGAVGLGLYKAGQAAVEYYFRPGWPAPPQKPQQGSTSGLRVIE